MTTDSTIFFLDLVRFTSLTDVHGDEAGADAASALVDVTTRHVSEDVKLIKTLGDGVLLSSVDSQSGLAIASQIVHDLHQLSMGLDVRGGAARGSVLVRDSDFFGTTVNLAARAAALTSPGHFLVTRPVALVAGAVGLAAEPLGQREVKGFSQSVELFAIDVCDHDGHWITDPVCGMRLEPAHVTEWEGSGGDAVGFCSAGCADLFLSAPERYPAAE